LGQLTPGSACGPAPEHCGRLAAGLEILGSSSSARATGAPTLAAYAAAKGPAVRNWPLDRLLLVYIMLIWISPARRGRYTYMKLCSSCSHIGSRRLKVLLEESIALPLTLLSCQSRSLRIRSRRLHTNSNGELAPEAPAAGALVASCSCPSYSACPMSISWYATAASEILTVYAAGVDSEAPTSPVVLISGTSWAGVVARPLPLSWLLIVGGQLLVDWSG
jgi:hypothetical protein